MMWAPARSSLVAALLMLSAYNTIHLFKAARPVNRALTLTVTHLDQHHAIEVCDGRPFKLECPNGRVIAKINAAFYGRSDDRVCPHKDEAAMENTACRLDTVLADMTRACIGNRRCFPASRYSADPCPGTFKYSSAVFTCVHIALDSERMGGGGAHSATK